MLLKCFTAFDAGRPGGARAASRPAPWVGAAAGVVTGRICKFTAEEDEEPQWRDRRRQATCSSRRAWLFRGVFTARLTR